uniref:Replication-associated protein n=1 Tax=Prunella montanella CRESS-DNA-virus sp. TaxID=2815056 RepID=A0A8A4XCJ8_9VIRU|nr:MAG: replication-associated protein [Prunella montanella CRESS-DNA-virus sp.]
MLAHLHCHLEGTELNASWILRAKMADDVRTATQLHSGQILPTVAGHLHARWARAEAMLGSAHCAFCSPSSMRTYGKNYKEHPSSVIRPTRADYKNRTAVEWDVRLDVVNGFTSSKALDHCVAHKDKIRFAFIGAEERPDNIGAIKATGTFNPQKPGSEEIHIHIAIVLEAPAKRHEVLELLRGPRSIGPGNEYAVPRNPKFTYAGWIAHHAKLEFKVNPDGPLKLYEYGDLPMDSYDEETCWKVVRILKKFGDEEMKQRFKSYSIKLDELKRMREEINAKTTEEEKDDEAPPAFAPSFQQLMQREKTGLQKKLGGDIQHFE